jgi:hypothetical protein
MQISQNGEGRVYAAIWVPLALSSYSKFLNYTSMFCQVEIYTLWKWNTMTQNIHV